MCYIRKLKLHELFVRWLVTTENTQWLGNLLDDVRSGKVAPQGRLPTTGHSAPPGSPVSRLIHSQLPFCGSPRVGRSASASQQPSTLNGGSIFGPDIDLGRGCVDFATGERAASERMDHERQTSSTVASSESHVPPCESSKEGEANEIQTPSVLGQFALAQAETKESSSTAKSAEYVSDSSATAIGASSTAEGSRPRSESIPESSSKSFSPGVSYSPASALDKTSGATAGTRNALEKAESSVAPSEACAADITRKISPLDDGYKESRSLGVCGLGDTMESEDLPRPTPSAALPPRPQTAAGTDSNMSDSSTSSRCRAIPRFYFPRGKGAEEREMREWEAIPTLFAKYRVTRRSVEGVTKSDFPEVVVNVLNLPSFFAPVIVERMLSGRTGEDTSDQQRSRGLKPTVSLEEDGTGRDAAFSRQSGSASSIPNEAPSGMSDDSGVAGSGDRASSDTSRSTATQPGFVSRAGQGSESSSAMNVDAEATTEDLELTSNQVLTEDKFRDHYMREFRTRSRESRMFYAILPPDARRNYLIPSDFRPILRSLLARHKGLAFLHATPEFQLRYSETVVERIFFSCSRTHNGRLTLEDIKRCRLLDTFMMVDEEEDINRERKYFSYEHFYVLYCRFWELDTDHDLQIDREDLMRYGGHSLTYRIVDRIFGGYARRLDNADNPGYMSYTDFIWFCLSEEDKNSDTAIDYWYRCIDMDGDGVITMYDMEFFYKEQLHRMESFGHEPVQIRDILCQLLDMVKPNACPPHVKKSDLKASRLAGNFFNVLFNLNKFFALETRDPLQIRQEHATPELTDWDRFAALEYLRLSAEEEGEEDDSWDEVADGSNPLCVGEAPF